MKIYYMMNSIYIYINRIAKIYIPNNKILIIIHNPWMIYITYFTISCIYFDTFFT